MKKNVNLNIKTATLIIVTAVCVCTVLSGCRGFSIGPRDGLFGIPIEFSKREKLPKSSLDELHEIILADNAAREMRQRNDYTAGVATGWLDVSEAPSADDWYAGITSTEGSSSEEPQHATTDSGIVQVSYAQHDASQGIVNTAMPRETLSGQYTGNNVAVPVPLEQDKWVANLELERYRDGKTEQLPESPWRWRHRGIEEILILPQEHQPNWLALSRHENALVRGNTLITLARAGDTQIGEALVALINDVSRSNAMRCAAVEALASLPSTKPETLMQLSDTYCDYTDANGQRRGGVPDLAIEVLYALATKIPISNAPCFVRPLESRDAKVRLAAVCLWRDHVPQQSGQGQAMLPDCVVRYCGDPNTAIQEAALTAVARWRHTQAMASLDLGLRNPKASVRIAAIHGLAILQTDESVALLLSLVNDPSSAIRAEVVTALGQVGLHDKVYQMCDDPGWEVRKAIARELAKSNNPRSHSISQKYLRDTSTQVQLATLESLRHWHPESTAELLFEAMGGNALETRYAATEMLAQYWEPARQYMANGRTEVRKQQYQQLAAQFEHDRQTGAFQASGFRLQETAQSINPETRSLKSEAVNAPTQADENRVRMLLTQLQHGGTPQQFHHTLAQLAETGPVLLPILEQIAIVEGRPLHDAVFRQVLPNVDSLFGILCRLENNDAGQRRAAIAELVGETKFGEVSPLLYRQLAAHASRENDDIVLQRLWDFIDRQAEKLTNASEQVAQQQQEMFSRELAQLCQSLTFTSLGHASPELHRRACVHLREYGQPDAIPALLAEINHPTTSVSRAALQALAQVGTMECAPQVRPLLTHTQPLVVVDAALALDHWGDPAGQNALERLAASGDRTTKLAVVQGIKRHFRLQVSGFRLQEMTLNINPEARSPKSEVRFVPLLVRLLDESGAIRQEALDALPLAAGHDVVPPQELAYYSTQERVDLWKQWGR